MPLSPADLRALFKLEPKAAVAYLQAKGYRLTWNWQEQLDEAHARAFTVAKVARLDVLQDIRDALAAALKEGRTVRDFIKDLTPTLQAKGWWGKQILVDSQGNAEVAQLGSPWRLRTIYHTNLQSAFMAGRYRAMADAADSHPYWQYVAVLDGRTRPSHRAMNGRVFRASDPLWNTAYPPNGFNCRCRARPMSEGALKREGLAWEGSGGRLRTITVDAGVDKRTGEVTQAQRTGIDIVDAHGKQVFFAPDAGFNFNAGKSWAKPFTPPPLDSLPRTFAPGQVLPDLPKAESFDAARLLPAGLDEPEYFARFMAEFPAEVSRTGVFRDVMGEPLTLNEDLFKDAAGRWKIKKNGRETYLPMLADAIRNPDEIWLNWQRVKSQPFVLRRRYLKVFAIEGESRPGMAVFEEGTDGWTGITLFSVGDAEVQKHGWQDAMAYIQGQRGGFLVYRRR
jgi:SPP1 gp7 family putative phage head morphogenesis protein